MRNSYYKSYSHLCQISVNTLRTVYYAHIFSHIRNNIIFWGFCSKANQIFILQKRALRLRTIFKAFTMSSRPWGQWQNRGYSNFRSYTPHRGRGFNNNVPVWNNPPNEFTCDGGYDNPRPLMQLPGPSGGWNGYTSFASNDEFRQEFNPSYNNNNNNPMMPPYYSTFNDHNNPNHSNYPRFGRPWNKPSDHVTRQNTRFTKVSSERCVSKDKPATATTGVGQIKTPSSFKQNNEEVALPGSEAARERERAEIAQRLKDMDKKNEKKAIELDNVQTSPEKTASQKDSNLKKNVLNKSKKMKCNNGKQIIVKKLTQKTKSLSKISDTEKSTNTDHIKKMSPCLSKSYKSVKRKMPVVNIPAAKRIAKMSKTRSGSSDRTSKKHIVMTESSEELKKQILARLSAMGKEELKFMIHHPQSPKAQDIMKALMKCYQETKALELDKRRFSLAQTQTTSNEATCIQDPVLPSAQGGFNFPELPSIAMTDLPQEVVSQIESFLGCNIFPTPVLPETVHATSNAVAVNNEASFNSLLAESQSTVNSAEQFDNWLQSSKVTNTGTSDVNNAAHLIDLADSYSDCDTVKAPSPSNEIPMSNQINEETPFLILSELSRIDMFIQESIARKMQLYQQLHAYLECRNNMEGRGNTSTSQHQNEARGIQPEPILNPIVESTNNVDMPSASDPQGTANISNNMVNVPKVETDDLAEQVNIWTDNNTALAARMSPCQDCLQLDSTGAPVIFDFPDKTNVNDMKVVSKKTVVLGCEDGSSYGYSLKTGKRTHVFEGHTAAITAVCGVQVPTQDDTKFQLCSGSLDEHLCIFYSENQSIIRRHYLASSVTCIETDHSRLLYIGLKCGQILKYDLQAYQLLENVLDCGSSITAILPTREGPRKVLIVAVSGKQLTMRDASTGLLLRTFNTTRNELSFSLAIYADRLYSGAAKCDVLAFDLLSGDQSNELSIDATVSCIRLYKHLLFVASYNGKIYVFDLKTNQRICHFSGAGLSLKTLQILNNRVITCSRSKSMESICFPENVIATLKAACPCCSN